MGRESTAAVRLSSFSSLSLFSLSFSFHLSTTILLVLICLTNVVLINAHDSTSNLPWGDLNILMVTDVHSWVGGHEASNLADYGNVLSFYQHLHHEIYNNNNNADQDLWFVMNGDWIDGTGVALNGDPSYLIPLLQKMPFDIVNCGNHELYKGPVIEYMKRPGGFIDWWGENYMTSNIVSSSDNAVPLGNRYTILQGQNANVLVFGFLYNMKNNDPIVLVEEVETVVQEPWFIKALTEQDYDAILIMAHMDHADSLVTVITQAIRTITADNNNEDEDIPIQFITGHTHYRGYSKVDDYAYSMEAGRYLDTIGFASFPKKSTLQAVKTATAIADTTTQDQQNQDLNNNNNNSLPSLPLTGSIPTIESLFQHEFIDAQVVTFQQILNIQTVDEFHTHDGLAMSKFVHETRESLGLTEIIGCAPRNYYLNRTMTDEDSMWRLYTEHVVQTEFIKNDPFKIMVLGQGSWRYDLITTKNNHHHHRQVSMDDAIGISPFNETIYFVGSVSGSIVYLLNHTLNPQNQDDTIKNFPFLPQYIFAHSGLTTGITQHVPIDPMEQYHLYTDHFSKDKIRQQIESLIPPDDNNDDNNSPGDVKATNYTSTNIWVSYIQNHWSCHPGLFHGGPNNDDDADLNNAVVVIVFVIGLLFLLPCCFMVFAFIFGLQKHNHDDDEKIQLVIMNNNEQQEQHLENDYDAGDGYNNNSQQERQRIMMYPHDEYDNNNNNNNPYNNDGRHNQDNGHYDYDKEEEEEEDYSNNDTPVFTIEETMNNNNNNDSYDADYEGDDEQGEFAGKRVFA